MNYNSSTNLYEVLRSTGRVKRICLRINYLGFTSSYAIYAEVISISKDMTSLVEPYLKKLKTEIESSKESLKALMLVNNEWAVHSLRDITCKVPAGFEIRQDDFYLSREQKSIADSRIKQANFDHIVDVNLA